MTEPLDMMVAVGHEEAPQPWRDESKPYGERLTAAMDGLEEARAERDDALQKLMGAEERLRQSQKREERMEAERNAERYDHAASRTHLWRAMGALGMAKAFAQVSVEAMMARCDAAEPPEGAGPQDRARMLTRFLEEYARVTEDPAGSNGVAIPGVAR